MTTPIDNYRTINLMSQQMKCNAMKRLVVVVTVFLFLCGEGWAAEKFCQVQSMIKTFYVYKPIDGCNEGDTISLQVDTERVNYNTVAGAYCDLSKTIIVEPYVMRGTIGELKADLSKSHVLCVYKHKEQSFGDVSGQ